MSTKRALNLEDFTLIGQLTSCGSVHHNPNSKRILIVMSAALVRQALALVDRDSALSSAPLSGVSKAPKRRKQRRFTVEEAGSASRSPKDVLQLNLRKLELIRKHSRVVLNERATRNVSRKVSGSLGAHKECLVADNRTCGHPPTPIGTPCDLPGQQHRLYRGGLPEVRGRVHAAGLK